MSNKSTVTLGILAGAVVLFLVAFVTLFTVILPRQRIRNTRVRLANLGITIDEVFAAYTRDTGDQPPYDIGKVKTRLATHIQERQVVTYDAWTKQIKITLKQTGGYELRSGGPDCQMFTNDDLELSKD